MSFINFKTILTTFIFAIFAQHHIQSDTMIIRSKRQFVMQSFIYRRTVLHCHLQLQCRRVTVINVSLYNSMRMENLRVLKYIGAVEYSTNFCEFKKTQKNLLILKNARNSQILLHK